MKQFHLGERVTVCGSFAPKEGGSVRYLDGYKGTIRKQDTGNGYEVKLDKNPFGPLEDNEIDSVHPRQLRKLVKKKGRKPVGGFMKQLLKGLGVLLLHLGLAALIILLAYIGEGL